VTSEGNQRFHSIVRRGFRYATLTIRNLTEPIKIRRVACLLNTFPVVERGDFLCSDPLLNQVWRMCRYTTRLCMDDTFVDCPAYEQTLWVGDARGEALIEYVTFGEYEMPKRCWRLTGRSLRRSPLTESQVPSGWKNVLTAWSFLWMLACEESYKWSGDKAFLKEIYPALAQNCKGIESFINPKGLLEIEAWNMLDWAPMDTPPSGVVTHQNALAVEALRSTARVARILDKERDAVHYLKGADRIRKAINEHLWSEKDQAFIDSIHADGERSKTISQQTNIMVFLCDCATPERERVIREYVARVQEGWVRVGSPFAMFFMFAALAKIGEFKEILRQTREKWGWMIDMGSTTCWETFPGPNAKWFTRSYCHAWSAGPAYFLSTYQLGVIPAGPGLRKVTVAPEPADLRWARGKVPTPYGEIEVSWTKKDQGFELSVALPKEVEGDAVLPVPCRTIRTEGRGVLGQRIRDSKWVVHLGKGASAKIVASE
jgi:alpha-L-rhamnosidase